MEITAVKRMDKNRFVTLLKLFAALDVFYGHAVEHLSLGSGAFTAAGISFRPVLSVLSKAVLGVPVFFFFSGYYIIRSAGRSNSFCAYARKRFLRIYPELWIAVAVELVSIIVLFKGALDIPKFALFGAGQASLFQFWTPDFLRGYGCGTPNGSLWTIPVTVQFYVFAWIFRKPLGSKKPLPWVILLAVSIGVSAADPLIHARLPEMAGKVYDVLLIRYLWMFLLGCIMAVFSEEIGAFLKKLWPAFLAAALVWLFAVPFDVYAGDYPLIYSLLFFPAAVGLIHAFPKFGPGIDISYGLYIYHMIVINAFIALGLTGRTLWFFVTLAISAALGLISTLIARRLTHKR